VDVVVGDALKRFHLVGPSWGQQKINLQDIAPNIFFELARQGYKEAEFLTERSASTIAELIVSLNYCLIVRLLLSEEVLDLLMGMFRKCRNIFPYILKFVM